MSWADKLQRLALWADRRPIWLQFIVLPPLIPLWLVVAAACHFPRTMALAAVVLAAVYVPLIASGIFTASWWATMAFLGKLYVGLMVLSLLGLVQGWSEQAVDRWLREEMSPKRPMSSSRLWDREIDG